MTIRPKKLLMKMKWKKKIEEDECNKIIII